MIIPDKRVYKFNLHGHRSVLLEASGPAELRKALVAAGVSEKQAKDWVDALWSDIGVRYQAGGMTVRHIGDMRYTEVSSARKAKGQATAAMPAGPKPVPESVPETHFLATVEHPTGQGQQAGSSEVQTLMDFINAQTS